MRGHEAKTKYFMKTVFSDEALGTLKDIFEFLSTLLMKTITTQMLILMAQTGDSRIMTK